MEPQLDLEEQVNSNDSSNLIDFFLSHFLNSVGALLPILELQNPLASPFHLL